LSAPDQQSSTSYPARLGNVERRRIAVPGAGVELSVLDWGGDGPLALLHHANGFCGALWAPIAEALRERFRVVALDARGHGESSLPPEGAAAFAWPTLAEDLACIARVLLDEAGQSSVALGIGHSFGGTLTLTAAATHPGLFQRALLVDPVIFPRMTAQEDAERAGKTGLAARARRRRHVWADRASALKYFAARGLFAGWQSEVLDLYVEEGLRERADGQVELKCPGAVEAHIFEGAHTLDIFGCSAGLEIPVDLLWASRGDFPRAIYEQLIAGMPGASIHDVDAGHLVPMQSPELVIAAADRLLAR
jgi:pimeloyl-ACP methyl ester carboxylesterase